MQVGRPCGMFIIRPSQSREGCYAIAVSLAAELDQVWTKLIIHEYNTISKKFKYFIDVDGAPRFDTLVTLVDAYRTHDLGSSRSRAGASCGRLGENAGVMTLTGNGNNSNLGQ